jgi:hypothetical protein
METVTGAVEMPRLADFGLTEIAMCAVGVLIWLGVMYRNRNVIRTRTKARDYRTVLMLVIIWAPLIGLLVRALYDAFIVPEPVAIFGASMSRIIYIIAGTVLLVLGPPEGEIPR